MLEHYLLLGTLGFHSLEDIKSRQITVMVTLGSALAGLICHLVYQSHSIYSMLGGMVFGGLILLFSVLSKGKIGQGDGIVFMLTGLYLGVEKNLALMLLSFDLGFVRWRYEESRRFVHSGDHTADAFDHPGNVSADL